MSVPRPERQFTRQGYLKNDYTADFESEGEEAMTYLRTYLQRSERRRRTNGEEYERLAKRQRAERIERGQPAEEEDNDSYSVNSDSEDDSNWEPEEEEEE
jgi:hypothetical protein